MEQSTRNKLRNVVTQCRKLLEESIAQQLEGQFGIRAGKKDAVQIEDEARMSHLSDEDRQYRRDLLDHFEHIKARSFKAKDALDQLIREIAFTHLNRLCAYKMMEARDVYVGGQKFREAVSRGINSNGFKFYLADHPADERLFSTGQQELAYRHFLDWLGGLLSEEIGVLFNPNDPANRLYPRQKTIDELLDLLNDGELTGIWEQDETVGWVYQYFTPKELRESSRDGGKPPKDSYELAFRNQFFTPRYVVEFLSDNTLGRIWFEMRKGDTNLAKEGDPAQCRYMVRRPNEIFLDEGQEPPEEVGSRQRAEGSEKDSAYCMPPTANLSQEELLKQPIHIPHRPKKDPRKLKILDPACGSGHFLLYCFDLLLTIYEEAYDDPDLGPALQRNYVTLDDLRRDMPRLILAHNLHGIDIDLRCTQIAALALWLRCQRAYQEMGLKKDRPKITRSNLVCAEPMPGEEGLLEEFLTTLHEDRLPKLVRRVMDVPENKPVRATPEMADRLCEMVRLVWDRMKLAGEAGSLLKIDSDLQEAIRKGQEEWEEEQPLFRVTQYGLTDEPQEKFIRVVPGEGVSFWQRAEALVMAALDDFAEYATSGRKLVRKLFVDDAIQGLAFVDVCRQLFDVVLMNPPFGDPSQATRELVRSYCDGNVNLLVSFVCRAQMLAPEGFIGAITDSTWLKKTDYTPLREHLSTHRRLPIVLADLGWDVLDEANVATCAFVCQSHGAEESVTAYRLVDTGSSHRGQQLRSCVGATLHSASMETQARSVFFRNWRFFDNFPSNAIAYETPDMLVMPFTLWKPLSQYSSPRRGYTPGDTFRFFRCWWEVPNHSRGESWWTLNNGSPYTPLIGQGFFVALHDAPDWDRYRTCKGFRLESEQWFGKPGIGWGKRTECMYAHPVPSRAMWSHEGPSVFPHDGCYWPILAYLNSSACQAIINLYCGQHKTAGYVGKVPCPDPVTEDMQLIGRIAEDVWKRVQAVAVRDETLENFQSVYFSTDGESLSGITETMAAADKEYRAGLAKINIHVREKLLGATCGPDTAMAKTHHADDVSLAPAIPSYALAVNQGSPGTDIVQWLFGLAVGRWDVRFATGGSTPTDVVDPEMAFPMCPPGMLQGPDGLPAKSQNVPDDYPIRIDWDGILVDDPGHQDDIVRRVRDVLEVIWKERADAIEKEACEIFGVRTLRGYFRKPGKGGFWDDHVKRYSKSRRKAPIYWLLQSSKKNYALWLYYQRLDKDMLFKALQYVETRFRLEAGDPDDPKVEGRLQTLRHQRAAAEGSAVKKIDREIEKQETLVSELREFAEKLRTVAELHLVPDLNDGVVLNIAPLHELVPWKEAKKYWEELLDGKYEWSTIGKQLREKGLVK